MLTRVVPWVTHGLFAEHLVKPIINAKNIQKKKKKKANYSHICRTQFVLSPLICSMLLSICLPSETMAHNELWQAGLLLGLRVILHQSTAELMRWLPTNPRSCSDLTCRGECHC